MSNLILDLSDNNGQVGFHALSVPVDGVKVAGIIAKATQGTVETDKYLAFNREQAERIGVPIGFYHFATPGYGPSAEQEALHFCAAVQSVGAKDLRPFLDLEQAGCDKAGGINLYEWTRTWMHTVDKKLGVLPGFYSDAGFFPTLNFPKPVGSCLWLADYGPNDGHEHPFPIVKPWKHLASIHQFTDVGHWPGVAGDVDMSYAPKMNSILAHPIRARLHV